LAIEELGPLMVIDARVGAVTLNGRTLDVIPPLLAEMLVMPPATPVARPLELMIATPGLEDVQLTTLVRFWVDPSLNVPMAVNWRVLPLAIDVVGAVMASDCNTGTAEKFTTLLATPLSVKL